MRSRLRFEMKVREEKQKHWNGHREIDRVYCNLKNNIVIEFTKKQGEVRCLIVRRDGKDQRGKCCM